MGLITMVHMDIGGSYDSVFSYQFALKPWLLDFSVSPSTCL